MNFAERLSKLVLPYLNTREQKPFLAELDLEIEYWGAIEERCKNEKQLESIKKNLTTLNEIRSVVSKDPKGLKWGYIDKKENIALNRSKNRIPVQKK